MKMSGTFLIEKHTPNPMADFTCFMEIPVDDYYRCSYAEIRAGKLSGHTVLYSPNMQVVEVRIPVARECNKTLFTFAERVKDMEQWKYTLHTIGTLYQHTTMTKEQSMYAAMVYMSIREYLDYEDNEVFISPLFVSCKSAEDIVKHFSEVVGRWDTAGYNALVEELDSHFTAIRMASDSGYVSGRNIRDVHTYMAHVYALVLENKLESALYVPEALHKLSSETLTDSTGL